MPGILLWSMPGIAAGAGLAAGLTAALGASLAADLAAGLVVVLGAQPLTPALMIVGALVIPSISMPMATVPDSSAIMRWSTGSVITRSRITGSAIMRMWMAIKLESELPVLDMFMPDMFALELVALGALPDALAADMFMPE